MANPGWYRNAWPDSNGKQPLTFPNSSDLKTDSFLFEERLQVRYKTDWFSITVAPSLFIANAASYGHDTVANGPAGNFSSVNTGGFTRTR